jgi:hypothetical protein
VGESSKGRVAGGKKNMMGGGAQENSKIQSYKFQRGAALPGRAWLGAEGHAALCVRWYGRARKKGQIKKREQIRKREKNWTD